MSNIKYFRINAIPKVENEEVDSFEDLIRAENVKEAEEKFIIKWFDAMGVEESPEDYDYLVAEVPLTELISEEQDKIRHRLITKYVMKNCEGMTIREFGQFMKPQYKERQDEMYFEELRLHLRRVRMDEYLEARLDCSKITHEDFCKIRDALCQADRGTDYEKIHREAIKKYGKEPQK